MVIPFDAAVPWADAPASAAYAQWITPDLPLYGNDHERSDFAP